MKKNQLRNFIFFIILLVPSEARRKYGICFFVVVPYSAFHQQETYRHLEGGTIEVLSTKS